MDILPTMQIPSIANESTSSSLLERLVSPDREEAWHEFYRLYSPLVLYWIRGHMKVPVEDTEEVLLNVFATLAKEMPNFRHNPKQRFRGYLFKIVKSRSVDLFRKKGYQPAPLPPDYEDADDELKAKIDHEHKEWLIRQMLERIRQHASERDWKIFYDLIWEKRTKADWRMNTI